MARRYPRSGGSWEVFGAAGFDAWTREIRSTAAASGGTEDWSVIYAAVGAGWSANAYSLRAGIKFPLAVDETTDFGVDLEPDGKASGFLRFSAVVRDDPRRRWDIQAYYETYRFDESDHVLVSTNLGLLEVWQPQSRQDVLGLRLLGYWR